MPGFIVIANLPTRFESDTTKELLKYQRSVRVHTSLFLSEVHVA